MTGVFVQIRLDSSRLPRKALLPLAGRTITDHVLAALSTIKADVHVLVTEPGSIGELEPLADAWGFRTYVGSKDDVLARFTGAAHEYGVDTVIRATGDNPLVSRELAEQLHVVHVECKADYSGFLEIPVGSGVEIINTEALFAAQRETEDPYDHEHVAPFLYRHPERFMVNRPVPAPEFRGGAFRITVDTFPDYETVCRIFSDLYEGEPIPILPLLEWLRLHNGSAGR